ncbi:TauD/TfdA family dioxygenase [Reyranella sp. CPCC 100927]|uniref:TauD/TfdA family dioxygenase n=1 Tax=Reyranella sp. CPCC 100927 TaxID=2599616 RepID=UPI0011B7A7D9|nr:TauD/TfdA family dioxygenase [Reyranella sp. CPCC 100927]TWS96159.1 TauD/TfdA family dioxygenase [Reyranella sp. CPCC 100927]
MNAPLTRADERYEPITDRSAWLHADMVSGEDWLFRFTPAELEELDTAIAANAGRAVTDITPASFAMPTLSDRLRRIADEVDTGRGMALLRGFPAERYTEAQCATALVGIGAHFGRLISQNMYGEMICSVRSTGRKLGEPGVRGYDTDSELRYHNDECDIIGLMCLQPAQSGGLSSMVSSASIFNAMLRDCPQHLEILFRGYIFSLMGEERPGVGPVSDHLIPVFSRHLGKISCRYTLNTIYQANRTTGVPLTAPEQAALDAVLEVAKRPEMRIDFQLDKGDIQFANNLSTLHARTAFVDYEDPKQWRHLHRVWLASHHPRPLAPAFEERFNDGWSFRKGIPVSRSR